MSAPSRAGTYTGLITGVEFSNTNHNLSTAASKSFTITVVNDNPLPGDVNSDQSVDVADIASIISVMAGSASSSIADNADVNGDGYVDVADIATVISIMAGDNLEVFAVQSGSTIVPNETIVATPSVRITPGNDTAWNTTYSIAIDYDSTEEFIDFKAGIYYPNNTTTRTFTGSMYGTNNPKDGELVDGVSSGNGYKHNLKNLPRSGKQFFLCRIIAHHPAVVRQSFCLRITPI